MKTSTTYSAYPQGSRSGGLDGHGFTAGRTVRETPDAVFIFKQLFAQVTNPPIDGIREEIITSCSVLLGNSGNLLDPDETKSACIFLEHPILTDEQLQKIKRLDDERFKTATISIFIKASEGVRAMARALERIFREADAIDGGTIIILSDRGVETQRGASGPAGFFRASPPPDQKRDPHQCGHRAGIRRTP